jgi:hypothetical protein
MKERNSKDHALERVRIANDLVTYRNTHADKRNK